MKFGWHACLLAGLVACRLTAPVAAAEPEALRRECEYGVTLALTGRVAAAESVFISLLTHAPGDPRALTNLGNLSLLRGDADVALGFYGRAAERDSTDAGILLNEAVALLLLGEDERARDRAREAVALVGDIRGATLLLALPGDTLEGYTPRQGNGKPLSREEVRALLREAIEKMPADTLSFGAAPGPKPGAATGRRTVIWRSGGARAIDGTEIAAAVYWKY